MLTVDEGDRVLVNTRKGPQSGTVMFIGETQSAGEMVGVALDEKRGYHTGVLDDVRYFECEQGYGLFVRPLDVRTILEPVNASNKTWECMRKEVVLVNRVIKHAYALPRDTKVEAGHDITGHSCITHQDRMAANQCNMDLLYGEVLPSGVDKMLDKEHLDAASATVLFDLGMGLGKCCMQAFLQYPNLAKVVGVELAYSRTEKGYAALGLLADMAPDRREFVKGVNGAVLTEYTPVDEEKIREEVTPLKGPRKMNTVERKRKGISRSGKERFCKVLFNCTRSQEPPSRGQRGQGCKGRADKENAVPSNNTFDTGKPPLRNPRDFSGDGVDDSKYETPVGPTPPRPGTVRRTLEFRRANLFQAVDAFEADVVILETKFFTSSYPEMCAFLVKLKEGCRILTYEDLAAVFASCGVQRCPFVRMPVNTRQDRFFTSWATRRGHRFHLWVHHRGGGVRGKQD